MEVYTIGFAHRSAEGFFDSISRAGVTRLLDVRRNNISQLAGFTKRDDLEFFLERIAGVKYRHETLLAPSSELLKSYRARRVTWAQFSRAFLGELAERSVEVHFPQSDLIPGTVLLCSEPSADRCHRRLVLEYLMDHGLGEIEPVHL